MAWVEVGSVEELPPGEMKLVRAGAVEVGVYNIDGELLALEDRCSHDDGPLCEGTGTRRRASSSAAPRVALTFARACRCRCRPSRPVETYPVRVENGTIEVDVP